MGHLTTITKKVRLENDEIYIKYSLINRSGKTLNFISTRYLGDDTEQFVNDFIKMLEENNLIKVKLV